MNTTPESERILDKLDELAHYIQEEIERITHQNS